LNPSGILINFNKKFMTAKEEIQKFKREFATLCNASEEKKAEFNDRFRSFIRSKTPDEKKEYAAAFNECAAEEVKNAKALIEDVNLRMQPDDVLQVVSTEHSISH
jgi:hypothetical protein